MTVHAEPLTTDAVGLLVYLYSGVPDDAPAHWHRLDFDAVCTVVWHPVSHRGVIKGLSIHGTLQMSDYIDMAEKLYDLYDIDSLSWERASGKRVTKYRIARRRWRTTFSWRSHGEPPAEPGR